MNKKTAEVEQKLAATRDVNTSLQSLLDKALTSQKQSSSNTSHLVKNIQMDLSRVMTENEQLRARIAELENQQIECEEKLAVMVIQAQEYASRLEQAQDTIHNLSEPKLLEEDELSSLNNYSTTNTTAFSVTSSQDNDRHHMMKESEITKGPVFSAEFRQEMQKEIERNLNLRNEIRHRIITAENSLTAGGDLKKKHAPAEGLKYLVSAERESTIGLAASLSTSTSSSTNSSILSTVKKESTITTSQHTQHTQQHHEVEEQQQLPQLPKQPILRPASFLTGFNGFGSSESIGSTGVAQQGVGLNSLNSPSFITRGIPPRTFTNTAIGTGPSISTRFFQRIASRFDDFDNSRKHTN